MLIVTGLKRNETNSEAGTVRKYIPSTRGRLHTSGLHRRRKACYGSRTEHEMTAGTTPVHSALSTAHNIIANYSLLCHGGSTYTIQSYTVDKTIKQKHHPRKNLTEDHKHEHNLLKPN